MVCQGDVILADLGGHVFHLMGELLVLTIY